MADSTLVLEVTLPGLEPATVAGEFLRGSPKESAVRIARLFEAAAGGVRNAKVHARVDSVTPYAARLAIGLTQSGIAAGETITFVLPGRPAFVFTAAASGADTSDYGFNSATSNTATATSLALAINSSPSKEFLSASSSTGTVTVVAKVPGTWGNSIACIDGTGGSVSGAGNFGGGLDASSRVSSSLVITNGNVTNGDTVTIGGTTLTFATSPSGESQMAIGGSATATGDNLVSAINAHSTLRGLMTASNAAGTVTITASCDPRAAAHVLRLATNDGTAFALTQPATNLTLASQAVTSSYGLGAP